MFGLFDFQEWRCRRAIRKCIRKLKSDPGGLEMWRALTIKMVAQRAEALRKICQTSKVRDFVFAILDEEFENWRKTHDPRVLHFIAEIMRVASMPEDCCKVLSRVLANRPRLFNIDITWLCLDMGLALHQKGAHVSETIKWFRRALEESAPNVAITADNEARSQAAFCGFIASESHQLKEQVGYFTACLAKLQPGLDLNNEKAVIAFSKTFVGFLSPDNNVQRVDANEKYLPRPNNNSVNCEASGKGGGRTFYQVLKFFNDSEGEKKIIVTAEAWVNDDVNEEAKYGVRMFDGADPLSFCEAKSAMYWKQQIDSHVVEKSQAVQWLRLLEATTSNVYVVTKENEPNEVSESALFGGLVAAALHFAIVHIDMLDFPESLVKWFHENFPSDSRRRQAKLADNLRGGVGGLDAAFRLHLVQSFGGMLKE